MDANRFDQMARAVSEAGTRRWLLRWLTTLPLVSVLATLLGLATEPFAALASQAGVGGGGRKRKKRRKRRRRKQRHKNKNKKGKGKSRCKAEPRAKTCRGRCGTVRNNCKKAVDCGSCECSPLCGDCRRCNEETRACEPDPQQVGEGCGDGRICQADGECACAGESCGGCRRCEAGQCVPDDTVVCTAQDQCHEAGVCDPETGQCTNPRKENGSPCDSDDPCLEETTCQQGVCTGTPRDCSGVGDVCNWGVCDAQSGQCVTEPRPNGTACNADNNSCTDGDSCQGGVCTPGAGVDCSGQDDACNVGVCNPENGQCVQEPRANGTACDSGDACTEGACQAGVCVPGSPMTCPVCQACSGGECQPVGEDAACGTVCCGGVCCESGGQCDVNECPVICLALREACDPGDNQCCAGSECAPNLPNCGDDGNHCCLETGGICGDNCECCGVSFCEGGACCSHTGSPCATASDCCQNVLNQQACVSGRCCALDGEPCEGPDDCCVGVCDPDGFCTGCLGLQQTCEGTGQCCQSGGETLCEPACDFDISSCCRPVGGACSGNCDCCGGHTCCNGVCCGFDEECAGGICQTICRGHGQNCLGEPDVCCSGFECRSADFQTVCRPDHCLEFLEECWTIGSRPCCTGECTTVIFGEARACCSPEGGPCDDLGIYFPGGHCCGSNVCNGAGICARCRQAGETCDGFNTASNCCNSLDPEAPILLCESGVCVLNPD